MQVFWTFVGAVLMALAIRVVVGRLLDWRFTIP